MNTRFNRPASSFWILRATHACRFLKITGILTGIMTLIAASGQALASDISMPIVKGNARFHVLTPGLVRMEYSPKARFVDEAILFVREVGGIIQLVFPPSIACGTCTSSAARGVGNLDYYGI